MNKLKEYFWKIHNFFYLYVYLSLVGKYSITKLFLSARSIKACTRINPFYRGPLIRVRNSIDGSEKDIYANTDYEDYEGLIVVKMYEQISEKENEKK